MVASKESKIKCDAQSVKQLTPKQKFTYETCLKMLVVGTQSEVGDFPVLSSLYIKCGMEWCRTMTVAAERVMARATRAE